MGSVWLGVSDVDEEGVFRWFGTGDEAMTARWADNEPNNAKEGEDCAVVTKKGWNDVTCLSPHSLIIEYDGVVKSEL
eukprot:CAMPEP_0201515422 /NCGR_PEP_ID=MMETSP0161_2-20130828/6998_1 /ASSEMBLY_ACC=CAM_ASM_000251 /TAXON_ID=180227 /ORGANISM="Neoparamoeba aestuarina, Strain SoJaBio B1-5/56/2" /LENGTH=76 /DNA_ID=CAMNT_0047912245 /DNA_START=473 /DNA_END=706 /DNA_ORIENTATION=+